MIRDRITELVRVPAADLVPNPKNWRRHPERQRRAIRDILAQIGYADALLARRDDDGRLVIIDGHLRAEETPGQDVPVLILDVTEDEADVILATLDPIAAMAEADSAALRDLLARVTLDSDVLHAALTKIADVVQSGLSLTDRFLIPPMSVLDTRQGYWRQRAREWKALGIRSEEGRDARAFGSPNSTDEVSRMIGATSDGQSIFDPVLCELAYRWFCPPGGRVLDPFAGGSVRGIVAAKCGRSYHGIDLRREQVEANEGQVVQIIGPSPESLLGDPTAQTPVEFHGGHLVKRDDRFGIGRSAGGKVRSCLALARTPGCRGLVTAGSRHSPQVNIVASVGAMLGLPVRAHVPAGATTPELAAAAAIGAEIVGHRPGYNTVIIARAREDAAERGWVEIPFGMETPVAVEQTAAQVRNLPFGDFTRIVIPVGSGMSLAGVLRGLREAGQDVPVLGVVVGADPSDRLDEHAPGWRNQVRLVRSHLEYDSHAPVTTLGDLALDPIYEAKALPFLKDGDLFWVVGCRETARAETGTVTYQVGDSAAILPDLPRDSFDMIFTCPPYFDLETYSDDPADLSKMPDDAFRDAYRNILGHAVERLRDNRFALIVVAEVRDSRGVYRGLVPGTIAAMEAAGCAYYNEAILVNCIGTAALRAGRQFDGSRKLARTHQSVLMFVKGDPVEATRAVGDITYGDIVADPEDL